MKTKCSSPDYPKLFTDFLKDYPDKKEELDPWFTLPFGTILEYKILVDSENAYELLTHQSLTGLLSFTNSSLMN